MPGSAVSREAIEKSGGALLVTADHGNCEMMRDPQTGGPHTAHTTNPVPLLLRRCAQPCAGRRRPPRRHRADAARTDGIAEAFGNDRRVAIARGLNLSSYLRGQRTSADPKDAWGRSCEHELTRRARPTVLCSEPKGLFVVIVASKGRMVPAADAGHVACGKSPKHVQILIETKPGWLCVMMTGSRHGYEATAVDWRELLFWAVAIAAISAVALLFIP